MYYSQTEHHWFGVKYILCARITYAQPDNGFLDYYRA